MATEVTEGEVVFKIKQAFQIAPVMTVSMLNAFLNARVPIPLRTAVLKNMEKDGLIVSKKRIVRTFRGTTSYMTVLEWQGQK